MNNKSKFGLLAVHLQGDIVSPEGGLADMFADQVNEREVLTVADRILKAARSAGIPVFYTRVAFASDYSDMVPNSPLLSATAQIGCLVDGTPLADISPEVAPGPNDVVVTHKRVGGFAGSNLQESLDNHGVKTLVMFGVATNASVETTARWASDLGYNVVIIEDACAAASQSAHEASISSLGMLAQISTSEEILSAFVSR